MKKLLAILMAMLLFICCLSGCGGEKDAADGDVTVVTVWSGDGGGQALHQELVKEWNATSGKEKGIKIDWIVSMDSQRVDVAQQNGSLPEIVGMSGTQVQKCALGGDIVPLEDLPGGAEFLEEFNQPGTEGTNVFNGKQYSVLRKAVTAGLVYNKDLFKKAGIVDEKGEAKAPTTIAELREAAKKITDVKNGVYGYCMPLKFTLYYTVGAQTKRSFGVNEGSSMDLDNLTVDYSGYKDMYQWLLDIKNDGSAFPGAEGLDNDTARAYFAQGKVGIMPAMSWDVGVYTTQFIIGDKFDWDVCEFPILDGKEEYIGSTDLSGGFVISKNALKSEKIAEATMEVYKWIYSLDFRKTCFENNIDLSSKTDVIEAADKDVIDPRFAKFASYVEEDKKSYPTAGSYVTEGDNWETLFQKVWMGQLTLDAAIEDISKRATEGLRKGVEKGTYDIEQAKANRAESLKDQEEWIKKNR